ncbi:coiled-coil domain-containing protein 12 [Diabrotica virgifera virgifera]|uniref:Coiled-coil domain-containing protein 12 n=1 Tax=Diabrotica virgifera virgifera TaxID=50390 RepID=A0A6P7F0Y7_DIAVI|nr:coiled-coil domain-containing protein 12 [Diabrotica virgifera virgifera]
MTESDSKIGRLEDEALKRKERLKNLKRKRQNDSSRDNNKKGAEGEALPTPLFRSYKPMNESLNEFALNPAEPGDVTTQVKNQLESAKSNVVIDQLDVTSLAPRKPDWDLKRDVAKKLAKLEKQTQKAIAELIRNRLKESKQEDLAAIVNAGASDL